MPKLTFALDPKTPQWGLHRSVEGGLAAEKSDKTPNLSAPSLIQSAINIGSISDSEDLTRTDKEEGNVKAEYLARFNKRFVDARWAPLDLASDQGPVIAILTTQLEVHFYTAYSNAYVGPWDRIGSLNGYTTLSLRYTSIVWLPTSETSGAEEGLRSHDCILLAATRTGEICAFRFGVGPKLLQFEKVKLCNAPIRALVSNTVWNKERNGQSINIAAVTSTCIITIFFFRPGNGRQDKFSFEVKTVLDDVGAAGILRWEGQCLLWTSPGQVHWFDVSKKSGKIRTFDLGGNKSSTKEDSTALLSAIAIHPLVTESTTQFEITLQDGQNYVVDMTEIESANAQVSSHARLPLHYFDGEERELCSLARQLEERQCLWGCEGDSSGLHFLVHSADEVANFGYPLRTQMRLTCLFTDARLHSASQWYVEDALSELRASVRGLSGSKEKAAFHAQFWRRTRALLVLMSTSLPRSDMSSKVRHFVDELSPYSEDTVDALSAVANCLDVSCGPSGGSSQSIAARAVDFRQARVILDNIDMAKRYLCRQTKTPANPDKSYGMLLAAVAHFMSRRHAEDLALARKLAEACASLLACLVTAAESRETLKAWKSIDAQGQDLRLGEVCPACDAQVTLAFGGDNLCWARCSAGHVWKRCSLSMALIAGTMVRSCSTCGSEFKMKTEAFCGLEESILGQSPSSCCICRSGQLIQR